MLKRLGGWITNRWQAIVGAVKADVGKGMDGWIGSIAWKLARLLGRAAIVAAIYTSIYLIGYCFFTSPEVIATLENLLGLFICLIILAALLLAPLGISMKRTGKELSPIFQHFLGVLAYWLVVRPAYYLIHKKYEPPKKDKKDKKKGHNNGGSHASH